MSMKIKINMNIHMTINNAYDDYGCENDELQK